MSLIKELREQLGLSQEDMSYYLGVTRSHLAMVERSERELPSEALIKLATLELSLEAGSRKRLAPSKTKEELKQHNKMIKAIEARTEGSRLTAIILRRKLQDMEISYDQHLTGLGIAEHIRSLTHAKDERQLTWVKVQHHYRTKKLNANSPAAQALLQAKIEMLEAEVAINERLLGKLRG